VTTPKIHRCSPKGRASVYTAWTMCGKRARCIYVTHKAAAVTCLDCLSVGEPAALAKARGEDAQR